MNLIIALIVPLLLITNAYASTQPLVGVYDLGPQAAAMVLRTDLDEVGLPIGILAFCHRKTLLEKGRCTGVSMPIRCKTSDVSWTCTEGGDYPFIGEITALGGDRVRYKFKSSFNEGDLEGKKLPIEIEAAAN